jgi:hypothetical protein
LEFKLQLVRARDKQNGNGVLPALNLTFSPGEKEQQLHVLGSADGVRQTQSCGFSRGRQTILLLLGEKAGLRESVKTNSIPVGIFDWPARCIASRSGSRRDFFWTKSLPGAKSKL